MKKEEITIFKNEQYELNATFFKSKDEQNTDVLVYFHGGGLIFGQKDDLPNEYIDLLNEKFNLLLVNYRLVPESTLEDIFSDITHIYDYAHERFKKVFVMGRSAGGYLSYIFSKKFKTDGAFILYGYYDFKHDDFKSLPKDKTQFAPMLNSTIEKQNVDSKIVTEKNPNPRFLLYLYYRNESLWQEKLGVDLLQDKYTLTDEDLKQMPRTFLVHSINDPDVPYDYSEHASKIIPDNRFITLDKNEHDFDRTVTNETLDIYKEAIEYLSQ